MGLGHLQFCEERPEKRNDKQGDRSKNKLVWNLPEHTSTEDFIHCNSTANPFIWLSNCFTNSKKLK